MNSEDTVLLHERRIREAARYPVTFPNPLTVADRLLGDSNQWPLLMSYMGWEPRIWTDDEGGERSGVAMIHNAEYLHVLEFWIAPIHGASVRWDTHEDGTLINLFESTDSWIESGTTFEAEINEYLAGFDNPAIKAYLFTQHITG